jgi:hypothetical protein
VPEQRATKTETSKVVTLSGLRSLVEGDEAGEERDDMDEEWEADTTCSSEVSLGEGRTSTLYPPV